MQKAQASFYARIVEVGERIVQNEKGLFTGVHGVDHGHAAAEADQVSGPFAHQGGISGKPLACDGDIKVGVRLNVGGGLACEHTVVLAEGAQKRMHVARGEGTAGLFQIGDCLHAYRIALLQGRKFGADLGESVCGRRGFLDFLPQILRLLPYRCQFLPACFLSLVKRSERRCEPVRNLLYGGRLRGRFGCSGRSLRRADPDLCLQATAPCLFFQDLLFGSAQAPAQRAQGGVQRLFFFPQSVQLLHERGRCACMAASVKEIEPAGGQKRGQEQKRQHAHMRQV